MSANHYPWIHRKVADEIYERIVQDNNSAVVYVVQAPAGIGKTILARDIGTRLGSFTGYEPAHVSQIVWSGILDIYDPDTNSNQGIEQRLRKAFALQGDEFEAYRVQREVYDSLFKVEGVMEIALEKQRQEVEAAFAKGMEIVSHDHRPVIVLDTIERLESAADPAQQELGMFDDTASVMGWLIFQITHLRQGVVLLLGRPAARFYDKLKKAVEEANKSREDLLPIELQPVNLSNLDPEELQAFFASRIGSYEGLEKLLSEDLQKLLAEKTEGNPLLLDLALQALLEKNDPRYVRQALEGQDGLETLERSLVQAYINSLDPDRGTLLRYLALVRNGLFADLLRALEPKRAKELLSSLEKMEKLPFIKVRDIGVAGPDQPEHPLRRTYFLHDAMYAICDKVLLRPVQVMQDSQEMVRWYDRNIEARSPRGQKPSAGRDPLLNDLLVESLFYRMRADPVQGYQWYLQQADAAIRTVRTGLDMRLRDAMALFLVSASPKQEGETGQSLSSPIDRDNVKKLAPHLAADFYLDSATLWIKRYTTRGKVDLARKIGKQVRPRAEAMYRQNPERYRLPFAEFLLWYGQAIMYGYEVQEALVIYREAADLLEEAYPQNKIEELRRTRSPDDFEAWRLCLVLGRIYNNLGYTHWMYRGQYKLAAQEFQRALYLFRLSNLDEELANTSDNMGRVHALLGHETQAIQLINTGLRTRADLGLTYRECLSATSLAREHIRFGRTELALKLIQDALGRFRRTGTERGVGLGLITQGMVYRNIAERWRETGMPIDEALNYTYRAETDLSEGMRIFTTTVKEPIRKVEAYNEMACCYRARYLLLMHRGASEAEKGIILEQGKSSFNRAIEIARQHGYYVEELDSLQDLAVLLNRAGKYAEAERCLEEIRTRVPDEYEIQPGVGFPPVCGPECVDVYYKLMGQVEMLAGAMAYDRASLEAQKQGGPGALPAKEAFQEAARLYLLAASYFNRYAGEDFVHRLIYSRIYIRFHSCPQEVAEELTKTHFPAWTKAYHLSPELVRSLFQEVLGLLS